MRLAAAAVLLGTLVSTGCGSSESGKIVVGAARTYHLAQFAPVTFHAGQPGRVSFTIAQPSGAPLTSYRTGAGPHTGVHLIMVRSDLAVLVHTHPPIGPDGRIGGQVTLPTPGRYRVIVDAYPNLDGPLRNFQLTRWITVRGRSVSRPLPPFRPSVDVSGYRVTLRTPPPLHAIRPALLTATVSRPGGSAARFTPWFGALAHAIFFREGSLDYFHTHVCAAGMTGCTSVFGGARVTGSSTSPGRLRIGVLLPLPGTWRLFLQCEVDGSVLTAPFTLKVR